MTQDDAPTSHAEEVGTAVGRKAERKAKARAERHLGLWFGIGMFGLVGWAVAVPTVAGILVGLWLDAALPLGFSWTLTCLGAGVFLGCLNAWRWVNREGRHPPRRPGAGSGTADGLPGPGAQ